VLSGAQELADGDGVPTAEGTITAGGAGSSGGAKARRRLEVAGGRHQDELEGNMAGDVTNGQGILGTIKSIPAAMRGIRAGSRRRQRGGFAFGKAGADVLGLAGRDCGRGDAPR